MSIKRWWAGATVALAVFSTTCGAGEPPMPFLTRAWQSEDGLPGDAMRSVVQASDGFLWVATAEGVVRFDGVQFLNFDAEPEAILAQLRRPRMLFPLPDGTVWIATGKNGLLRWDGKHMNAVLPEQKIAGPIEQVVLYKDGTLVRSKAEVVRIPRNGAWFIAPRSREIDALLAADAKFWLQHGRVMAGGDVPCLLDQKRRCWTGSPSGLVVSSGSGRTTVIGGPEEYSELSEDNEGNIWAATRNHGLLRVTEAKVRMITAADGLLDRTPLALLEDRSGALWIGTKNGKLNRMANGTVTSFDLASGTGKELVSVLCEDRTGAIWAATASGVYRQDGQGFARPSPTRALVNVRAIVEDAAGRLYFGGRQGLSVLEAGVTKPLGADERLQDITTMAVDGDSAVLIGTQNGALLKVTAGKVAALLKPESLGRKPVSAILPDKDGSLWVTTLGAGLFRLAQGRLTRFSGGEAIPDSRLTGVVDDGAGSLWLGSLGGIFRTRKAELNEIVAGTRTHANVLQLDRTDGLLTRECKGDLQPAGCLRRDGTVCFPTEDGIAVIRPDRFMPAGAASRVVIEAGSADGKPLDVSSGLLRVGPGTVHLEFAFAALSLTAGEKERFQVRCVGLENEWRDIGSQHAISYEAVPPGSYRFQVLAAGSNGVWNETGAAVAIRVRPLLWQTLWFRVALAASAAALVFIAAWSIARARGRHRLLILGVEVAKQTERIRIAQDLHDDFGSRLTEISMLAGLASDDQIEGYRAKDTLPKIMAKARALACALDEVIWAVDPRHDTVTSLADYLATYGAEFLTAAGISPRLELANDIPRAALDQTRRHQLFLALSEALNNAVKHSGAREVLLRLWFEGETMHLLVRDEGCGFDPSNPVTGWGLQSMSTRLQDLGGQCRVESAPGSGTCVRFSVPIRQPPCHPYRRGHPRSSLQSARREL